MTAINLSVNVNLETELSEEEVSTLASDLIFELSNTAGRTVSLKSRTFEGVREAGYLKSAVTIKLDESFADSGAKNAATDLSRDLSASPTVEVLESLGSDFETLADTHDRVARGWGPDEGDQSSIDAGLAAGYRGASEAIRERIEKI